MLFVKTSLRKFTGANPLRKWLLFTTSITAYLYNSYYNFESMFAPVLLSTYPFCHHHSFSSHCLNMSTQSFIFFNTFYITLLAHIAKYLSLFLQYLGMVLHLVGTELNFLCIELECTSWI